MLFKKCNHKKITPFSTGRFCPDCGQEILISWLILRCACCDTKREATVFLNSVTPKNRYCIKCGTAEYFIERKDVLEFIDLEYAVISKKEAANNRKTSEILQIWIEKEGKHNSDQGKVRLIPLKT